MKKINLLETCKTVNKFSINCPSKSFLDSSILTENNNLKVLRNLCQYTRLNFEPTTLLVCINDLPQGVRCNANLFEDDTLLFQTISSPAISSSNLNEDLLKITEWAYQWKMSFNPDKTKKTQFFFYQKKNDTSHPSLYFNHARIQQQSVQKHLGFFLD